MSLAELLASQEIAYDSEDAVRLGGRIARTCVEEATRTSAELAEQRGPFTLFGESVLATRSWARTRFSVRVDRVSSRWRAKSSSGA